MYPAPYRSPYPLPVRPRYRDSRRLVRLAAMLWAAAAMVAFVVNLVRAERAADRLARYRAGEAPVTSLDDTFRYGNIFFGGTSTLAGALGLAGLVLVMVAAYRLAKNHQAFGRPGTRWTPGWAIGGWLIPLASAVIPYLQLRDLWRGSDPDLGPDAYDWTTRRSHRAVWIALGLSIAGAVLGVVVTVRILGATLDSFPTLGDRAVYRVSLAEATVDARPLQTLADILGVLTASLTAWLYITVSERQHALAEGLRLGGAAAPTFPSPADPSPADPSLAVDSPEPPAPFGVPGASALPWPIFPPGWFPDPWGRFQLRWWDGARWTSHVSAVGRTAHDPLDASPPAPPT